MNDTVYIEVAGVMFEVKRLQEEIPAPEELREPDQENAVIGGPVQYEASAIVGESDRNRFDIGRRFIVLNPWFEDFGGPDRLIFSVMHQRRMDDGRYFVWSTLDFKPRILL